MPSESRPRCPSLVKRRKYSRFWFLWPCTILRGGDIVAERIGWSRMRRARRENLGGRLSFVKHTAKPEVRQARPQQQSRLHNPSRDVVVQSNLQSAAFDASDSSGRPYHYSNVRKPILAAVSVPLACMVRSSWDSTNGHLVTHGKYVCIKEISGFSVAVAYALSLLMTRPAIFDAL